MKAVLYDPSGDLESLRLGSAPDPVPGPEDLLVRNFAAALNRADILQRRGLYPPPPGESEILGLEFAGEVLAAGGAVRGFARGDRVFGLVGGGAYAELVRVHHRLAIAIPDSFSFELAAATPEAFFTAGENLFSLGGLRSGETLLVHAGASGVGSAAIQLGRLAGARVIATARSEEKRRLCTELGAERALDPAAGFADPVRELTGHRGADVILDLVGASYWGENLRTLAIGGRLLLVGLVGGSRTEVELSTFLRKRITVRGSTLRGLPLAEKIAVAERFRERDLPRLANGQLRPILDRVYPADEVRSAHERMEKNLNLGKIVLRF